MDGCIFQEAVHLEGTLVVLIRIVGVAHCLEEGWMLRKEHHGQVRVLVVQELDDLLSLWKSNSSSHMVDN